MYPTSYWNKPKKSLKPKFELFKRHRHYAAKIIEVMKDLRFKWRREWNALVLEYNEKNSSVPI